MRRKRSDLSKFRVADDVAEAIKSLAESTGWSEPVCLNFLARAGAGALTGRPEKLASYRVLVSAATEHHQTEVAAKRKLSATAAKLREARRNLESKPQRPAR